MTIIMENGNVTLSLTRAEASRIAIAMANEYDTNDELAMQFLDELYGCDLPECV